jgi:hypothetical protein
MLRSGQIELMDDLKKEKARILLRQHFSLFLRVFIAGFILAAVFLVPVVIWIPGAQVQTLKEQITTANDRRQKWEEESKRQAQLAEHYRDRFLAVTKTNASFNGFTHEDLQDYALKMIRALQVPIREHETIINKLESDPGKTLEERSTAEWEAGQKCMAEYNIRFKSNVITLRREILSRIPASHGVDQKGLPTDYWYDNPWNFYGFKKMVADLDRIAKELPVSKGQAKNR